MTSRFRMPAEWEQHEGTWIAWPHEKSDWPGKFGPIQWVYGEFVKRLSRVERVHILVANESVERNARKAARMSGAVMDALEFVQCPTDRSWTRDYCPIFLRDARGRLSVGDWKFTGWAKYPNSEVDDAVPSAVAARLRMRAVQPKLGRKRVVLEGGSIDVNGSGLLLTTEECLLSDVQVRNPGFARDDYERVFSEYLGISETIWLQRGIAGDDTHGHVDDLCRFVSANTVVLALEREGGDENFEPTQENLRLLKARKDLRVVVLPMPEPVVFSGQRLPASYANFYIANELVLMPTFNDPNDRVALTTLAKLFPDREVVGIHSTDLVLGLGTLHCMTQQQPL